MTRAFRCDKISYFSPQIYNAMIACQKELFSLPDDLTYLNCAYMSPLLKSLESIGYDSILKKRDPTKITPADFFQPVTELRQLFATLIQTPEWQRIAIVPSASYGLANVALNIPIKKGQNIVVASEQFPSNIYIWQRLAEQNQAEVKMVAPGDYLEENLDSRAESWNESILNAIDENTKIVAISNTHWADGTLFDLMTIRALTRQVGALLIIDATQSLGALPLNISTLQPDALVCAGYKWLMGPYAIGMAYMGTAFDNGLPMEENWINKIGSENFQGLVDYKADYQPGAARYSVGEQSNFILVPMMTAALRQILEWGVDNIQEYCKAISAPFATAIRNLELSIETEQWRCGHLFGVRLPQSADWGKLQSALQENKVYISLRGNAVRIAPHLYNTQQDFEKLLDCIKKALNG